VVGIPARPVDRTEKKPRFEAYGTPSDPCLDPLLHEVDLLRGELTDLENRIASLARDRIA
jgi:serine O-acetyltransferase